VDRSILLEKMTSYGIKAPVFDSLLSDRKQYVCITRGTESIRSATKSTVLGVAQGGCNSSLLFTLLINDLPNSIKNSLTVMFADDTNIVISGPVDQFFNTITKIEDDLTSNLN